MTTTLRIVYRARNVSPAPAPANLMHCARTHTYAYASPRSKSAFRRRL